MKLSDLYTTGTVAKRNNDGSAVAYVCTRTLSELYPDLDMDFDTSILLNNGSTSELMSKGAYGTNFTAYNKSNTLYNGEPTKQITYLGCCIVRGWDSGNIINLSKHLISSGTSWENVTKDLRFVINVVSSDGIGYTDYIPFDLNTTKNIIYNFNSTYVLGEFGYRKTNTTRDTTGYVNDVHSLDGLGDDGNNGNRICSDMYTVWGTSYNKYLSDTNTISKTSIGNLCFVYYIDGQYFMLKGNFNTPDSGYNHQKFTVDNIKYYLTIGAFKEFDDGISGFLPENDETKGAFAFRHNASGQYVNCTNYFVTSNCADYSFNSCGLRWVTTNSISTAKDFRDTVRLGVMDKNGIISHKEWITGESGIQASDNPNKDTSYDNIPDRPSSSGGDEDELDDSEMTLNANGNSFIKWFAVTGQNLLSLIDSFNSETVPAGFVPLDHIVGVYQAPFNIPDFSNCGALTNIFVGKYDTNVQGMALLNQGSYSTTGIIASKYIEPTHNNFLDYEPYTSLSLYLPFCGSCNLDANLFVGKTVNVDYYFDIFSGDVIANVYANGTLYKTLSGNFTISQPITSQNVGLQKDTVIKGAVGVATNMLGTAGFAMSGNISGALSGAVGATISSISTYTHLNGISPVATKGGGGRSIFYTCKNIILYKSTAIEKHGAYEKYRGKVCNYDSKLSECHGYTVVDNPHIEIKCTNTEKDEIKKLLEDGVILP